MIKRPGEALATRPLHFIWIADCSGSMAGEKINSLNFAIREALPAMRSVAEENPNAEILCRAISFESNAKWHIPTPTPVDDFEWIDLSVGGLTSMGAALKLVAKELSMENMAERALPPVLVLLSDGAPTDDFRSGLNELTSSPWGRKAVKLSIAIGSNVDLDVLQDFIGHDEIKPLVANNSAQLVDYIKWASTVVLKAASSPNSRTADQEPSKTNIQIPQPPNTSTDNIGTLDVF